MLELRMIPVEQLKRCPIQLRPVRKGTLEYYMLRDSIKEDGIIVSLLVRPYEDHYQVVDGGHRYEIALDASIPMLPCMIVEMTDRQVLEKQIITHVSRIETTPVEYCQRLWRLIHVDQEMTVNELAHSLKRHPDWVKRMLNLVRLSDKAQVLLKKGEITSKIAVEMAKLPIVSQDELLESLETTTRKEFLDLTIAEVRHLTQGKKDVRHESNLQLEYRYRKMKEVIYELVHPTVAASIILAAGAKTKIEIFQAALAWVLKTDKASKLEDLIRRNRNEAKEAILLKRRIAEHEKKENLNDNCTDNCCIADQPPID